ncbi:MAG: Gfo/Idh/MocA family oxidoreductase [Bacteroidota bacterium]
MKETHNPKSSLDRRGFIKAGTLATGAILLPDWMQASHHISGDDTIKIGLIGCGGRGTGAAVQALSSGQNVKLVAMADAFRDRLDKSFENIASQNYKDAKGKKVSGDQMVNVPEEQKFIGFDAYQKVLPLVDVVILATPPGFRPIHFEAAVNAGKHVFMEKPVAVDGPGVRRVLESAKVAKEKKLNVVVGLQRHYQKEYTEWVDRIHQGEIGDITTARVYWNSGGVWVREREEDQSELEYQMRNWYYFNWLCGDHITEQHIHNLDVGNWVMKAYPEKAYGMGGRRMRNGKDHGEIFDHHFVEFTYPDDRVMISQCRHWQNTPNRVTESFIGTKGTAPRPGRLLDANGKRLMRYNAKKDESPYQIEHNVLFEAIAKGEYKFADAENGAYASLTSIMGRMATYSGEVVSWEQALNSEMILAPGLDNMSWNSDAPVQPKEDGSYHVPVPGVTKVY